VLIERSCAQSRSNGFVGTALCKALAAAGFPLRAATRDISVLGEYDTVCVGDIGSRTDWRPALADVDCVVHLAAHVHVLNERERDARQYLSVNALGTRTLARQAAVAGVRRFILLSTVKVLGEGRPSPYTAADPACPDNAYARSKWAAEQALGQVTMDQGMEGVVVRPPLVYGPGVGGNFARLCSLVARGVPLPLGAVRNARSLISVYNLSDFLIRCVDNSEVSGRAFLVSDGENLSTPELVRKIAVAMQRPARLVPVPLPLLRILMTLNGKQREFTRLCESLTVDISATRASLDWHPPISVDEGIRRTVSE